MRCLSETIAYAKGRDDSSPGSFAVEASVLGNEDSELRAEVN